MSGFETREMEGALFRAERENERQPTYRGNIRINGTFYLVSAWERVAKSGRHWIALKAELPRPRAETAPLPEPRPAAQSPAPAPASAPPAAEDPDFHAPLEF